MNLILQKLLNNAKKGEETNSSPPFLNTIQAEKQDRPLPDGLSEQQDIPYGDPDAALFADVTYPKKREGKAFPVVVFVHGGALVTGDRKADRVFCQEFALRGFVVYSVEYRLIDRADAFGMTADLCSALTLVKDSADRFGGDPGRVSLCAESAGAFLSLYVTAIEESETLQQMFGCEKHGLSISHLILISGMIYTTGHDAISLLYKKDLYGKQSSNRVFMKFIDPDNPGILSLLPPIFLVTSKEDFLHRQTLHFAGTLEQNGHDHKLLYYPEGQALTHAFPALMPSLPESREVLDRIRDWMMTV